MNHMSFGTLIRLSFLISLTIGVGYVIFSSQPQPYPDSTEYIRLGYNIASGNGCVFEPHHPTVRRPIGYPLFLSAFFCLFGVNLKIIGIFQALLNAITVVLLMFIARALTNQRIAVIAGFMAALYPITIAYTNVILTETLFIFFFALSIYFFVKSDNGKNLLILFTSGIVLGLATIVRPNTIFFPAVVAIALYVRRSQTLRRSVTVFCLGFILAIAPVTLRNWNTFHVFLPVSVAGGRNIFYTAIMSVGGTYEGAMDMIETKYKRLSAASGNDIGGRYFDPEIPLAAEIIQEGLSIIVHNPVKYFLRIIRVQLPLWLSSHSAAFDIDKPLSTYLSQHAWGMILIRIALYAMHGLILCTAALGVFALRQSWRIWSIVAGVVVYFNLHVLLEFCSRIVFPAYPFMLIFSAAGITFIHSYLQRKIT